MSENKKSALAEKKGEKTTPPEAPLLHNGYFIKPVDFPNGLIDTIVDQEGNPAPCPLVNPQPMPGTLAGTINIQVRPCSANCLFWKYHSAGKDTTVHHLCINQILTYKSWK